MTRIANDPADFVPQALAGFVAAHGDLVRAVDGGVVRAAPAPRGTVALIVGGGPGHFKMLPHTAPGSHAGAHDAGERRINRNRAYAKMKELLEELGPSPFDEPAQETRP